MTGWPEVGRNIYSLRIEADPAPGAPFVLKPKRGPRLNFTIGEFAVPGRHSGVRWMPGANMHARHNLIPQDAGTRTRVDIEIRGPFARLWRWIVGIRHATGMLARTTHFIKGSRRRAGAAEAG